MLLNFQQSNVVDAPVDSNLVVIAGAGTGKTRVIVSRIEKLLNEPNVVPEQILAISFSKETKEELVNRLKTDLGQAADRIQVYTFNALGLKIINTYKAEALLDPDTKTKTEYELNNELRRFFRNTYKFFPLAQSIEEDRFNDIGALAAMCNNEKDKKLSVTLCDNWQPMQAPLITRLSNSVNCPNIQLQDVAQDFSLAFLKPIKPDLQSQYEAYDFLKQYPYWAEQCICTDKTHRFLLSQIWNVLDNATEFALAQHWQNALWLNRGSLDILGNCWNELDMFFNDFTKLGLPDHQYTYVSNRFYFSIQEMLSYVLKRKESGYLPRISYEKFQYYKQPENFFRAWNRAHPCDLLRLKDIAPKELQAGLYCPFKKPIHLGIKEAENNALKDVLSELSNSDKQAPAHNGSSIRLAQGDANAIVVGTSVQGVKTNERSSGSVDISTTMGQDVPEHLMLYKLFFKGGADSKFLLSQGKNCSCSYCPYFLDWYELLFALYEEWREENHFLDFPEQINRSVRLLAAFETIKLTEQQKYRFIFVDEFQDTNQVQYDMLRLLKSQSQNQYAASNYLCVVGDDDQAIYGWRGASYKCLDHIRSFLGLRKNEIKELVINYRSNQNILNVANALINHNSYRIINKRLITPSAYNYERQWAPTKVGYDQASPRVCFASIGSYTLEGSVVVQAIKYLHDKLEIPYNEIAVLFRVNSLSSVIEFSLMQERIPYSIKEQAFASLTPIKHALAALRLALDPNDDVAFLVLSNCFLQKKGNALLKQLQDKQFELGNEDGKSYLAIQSDGFGGQGHNLSAFDKQLKAKSMGRDTKTHRTKVRLEDLVNVAKLDIYHVHRPSLYEVASRIAEGGEGSFVNRDLAQFCTNICERIKSVLNWVEADSLTSVMHKILVEIGLKEFYDKADNSLDMDDEDDLFGRDRWTIIERLITLAEISTKKIGVPDKEGEQDDKADDTTGEASTHKEQQTNKDGSDYTQEIIKLNQEMLNRFLDEARKMDPFIDTDLKDYQAEIVKIRHQVRNIVFQLDQGSNAPWSEAMRRKQLDNAHAEADAEQGVQLQSIHASKGKEFTAVILIGFESFVMPYHANIGDPERLDEERRLAYVAFTRAKRYLLSTYCDSRKTKLDTIRPTGCSSFLQEIESEWQSLPEHQRPFIAFDFKDDIFSSMSKNIWEGKIDLIGTKYQPVVQPPKS